MCVCVVERGGDATCLEHGRSLLAGRVLGIFPFVITSRSNFLLITMRTTVQQTELVAHHCFRFVFGVKYVRSCTSILRLRSHGLVLRYDSNLPLCFEISEVNQACPDILETFRCPLWVAGRNIDQCHRGVSLIYHTGTTPLSHPRSTSCHSAAYVYTAFAFPPVPRSFEGLLTDDVRTDNLIQVYTWINN